MSGTCYILKEISILSLFTILLTVLLACVAPKSKAETETAIEDPIECGYDIGEYACNFTFLNQKGKKVSLWDFTGQTILLDFSTAWCYFCQVAAMEESNLLEEYKSHNLVWVTVLLQDREGNKPSINDLKAWASKYDLKDPILSGDESVVDFENDEINTGYKCGGYPTFVLIDKGMIIDQYMFGWSSSGIRQILDEHFQLRVK